MTDSSARAAAGGSGMALRGRLAVLGVIVALLVPVGVLSALDVPPLRGRVNDYAGMISVPAREQLENKLRALEESDSTQLVILTIPTLDGEDLEQYSIRVAESWGIGQKEYDNGILLLVAQEQRKVRIEVGYGLEGRLTDLQAGRIVDYEIVPSFKAGNFDEGFIRGVDAITAAVRGEYQGKGPARQASSGRSARGSVIPFLVLAVILAAIGSRRRIISAIAGAILLPLVALFALPFSWILLLLMLPAGFVGGLILPSLFLFSGRHWGGGYRGGGFGGSSGGFSGGGFSGGGGGFGGGGASG
jgi:uncharacterized protein